MKPHRNFNTLKTKNGKPAISLILLAILFVVAGASLILGPSEIHISTSELLSCLSNHLFHNSSRSEIIDTILWDIRIPRCMQTMAVGSMLALAGVAFQGLLQNPLADPFITGVSAGSAVGAALVEIAGFSAALFGWVQVGAAFASGILAVVVVYRLSTINGRTSVNSFLLSGVIVGSLLWSLIPFSMALLQRTTETTRLMFYLMGSLQSATWTRVTMSYLLLFFGIYVLRRMAAQLNLISMGEEAAVSLGVQVQKVKLNVIGIGSLLTAASVSVSGIIAFVGLVAPHFARQLVGPDHRRLVFTSAVIGSALLVCADTISRVWMNEMPVGILTSLIGAPIFCLLMRRSSVSSQL